ncbi:MAG: AIR synthase-related protein, partial [Planctomycetota bacterium]
GRDLPRLARSSGVGARLDALQIPIHPDAAGMGDDRSPLEHALYDGEDFELLLAHAPLDPALRQVLEAAGVHLLEIGRVVEAGRGIALVRDGRTEPLAQRGFDHFDPR